MNNNMRLIHWNVGGFSTATAKDRTKILDKLSPDVILMTEVRNNNGFEILYDKFITKKNMQHLSSVNIANNTDSHPANARDKGKNGNLIIAKNIDFGEIIGPPGVSTNNNLKWIHVLLPDFDLEIGCFHSANWSNKADCLNMYKWLWSKLKNKKEKFILMGDFNAVLYQQGREKDFPFKAKVNRHGQVVCDYKLKGHSHPLLKAFINHPEHLNYVVPEGGMQQYSQYKFKTLIDHALVTNDLFKLKPVHWYHPGLGKDHKISVLDFH